MVTYVTNLFYNAKTGEYTVCIIVMSGLIYFTHIVVSMDRMIYYI